MFISAESHAMLIHSNVAISIAATDSVPAVVGELGLSNEEDTPDTKFFRDGAVAGRDGCEEAVVASCRVHAQQGIGADVVLEQRGDAVELGEDGLGSACSRMHRLVAEV